MISESTLLDPRRPKPHPRKRHEERGPTPTLFFTLTIEGCLYETQLGSPGVGVVPTGHLRHPKSVVTILVTFDCRAAGKEANAHSGPEWQIVCPPGMGKGISAILRPRDLHYRKLPRGDVLLQPQLLYLEVPNFANSLA